MKQLFFIFIFFSFSAFGESKIKLYQNGGGDSQYLFYFENRDDGNLHIGFSPSESFDESSDAWLVFNKKKLKLGISAVKDNTAWLSPLPQNYANMIKGSLALKVVAANQYNRINGEFINRGLDRIVAVIEGKQTSPAQSAYVDSRPPLDVSKLSGNEIIARLELAKDLFSDCKIDIKVYAGGSNDYKATLCALESVQMYRDVAEIASYFKGKSEKGFLEKLTAPQMNLATSHLIKINADYSYIDLWLKRNFSSK